MHKVLNNPWIRSIGCHFVILLMLLIFGISYREPISEKVQSVTVHLSSPAPKSNKKVTVQKNSIKNSLKKDVVKAKTKQYVKKVVQSKNKTPAKHIKKKVITKKVKRSDPKLKQAPKKVKIDKKNKKAKTTQPVKLSKQLEKSMLSNMDQMLKQEQALLDNESQRLLDEAFMMSKQKVLDHLRAYWKVPAGLDKDLSVLLEISCDPNGEVMSVKIVRSSGNVVLDRSSRRTVLKSSPLPMPKRNEIKSLFRHFQLTLKP